MHPTCAFRGTPERGCEHHAEMASLLLDRPYESASSPLFNSSETTEGDTVCFKNLLVGTAKLGFTEPSEAVWPGFINAIRQGAGVSLTAKPKKQRITIFRKYGRRTFLNYDALEQHLKNRFNVEVDVMDPAKLTLPEQLTYMQDTTGEPRPLPFTHGHKT